METAVVLLVYRRSEETERVLRAIAEAAPARLYVFGDGPRTEEEVARVAAVRDVVERNVNWIVDADIRSFFDSIDHGCLMKFVEVRIADPRVLRLLSTWLH